jgi:hypothetical protein
MAISFGVGVAMGALWSGGWGWGCGWGGNNNITVNRNNNFNRNTNITVETAAEIQATVGSTSLHIEAVPRTGTEQPQTSLAVRRVGTP